MNILPMNVSILQYEYYESNTVQGLCYGKCTDNSQTVYSNYY